MNRWAESSSALPVNLRSMSLFNPRALNRTFTLSTIARQLARPRKEVVDAATVHRCACAEIFVHNAIS